jgi:hypothetical protein
MCNTYFFKLINLENMDIKKLQIELERLKIKYKKQDNTIYVYLKNFNIVNFVYNLLLLAVIANTKHIHTNLKLNRDLLLNNQEVALLLIKIFNSIKDYEKQEIKKEGQVSEKIGTLNLSNKNCILEDKNKIIHSNLEKFLGNVYMQQLRDLIKLIPHKTQNPFLQRYNEILINNIKLDEVNLDW